jgi:hypothetical protein
MIIETGLSREKFQEYWNALTELSVGCTEYVETYPTSVTLMLRDATDKHVALICEETTPAYRNTTNRETVRRFVTHRGYKILESNGRF